MWIGLILAGGLSHRMGSDKALLEVGGRTLLVRAIDVVRAAGGEPVVLGRRRPESVLAGARQVDETEGGGEPRGPLGALSYGLRLSGGRPVLALACDLPLIPADLVRFLLSEARRFDAVVPRAGGKLHVLAAAYTSACLESIERHLESGNRSVHGFLSEVRLRLVEEEELAAYGGPEVLLNVNTPDDLARAARYLSGDER